MEEQNQKSIATAVFEKIKTGQVKMRPKVYFVLKTILAVFAVVLFVLLILYLVSFIFFSLRASGTWFMPKFGFPGVKIFFASLPWLPIAAVAIFVVVLEALAKRFNFIYRKPIIYSFLGIVLIAIIGGFLLEKTPLHSVLFSKARERNLPGIGSFYRGFSGPQTKGAQFGAVIMVLENAFVIQRPDGGTTTITITEQTRFPMDEAVQEGDKIIVMGKPTEGGVEAFEIRQVREGLDFFPARPPHENPPLPGEIIN